MPEMPQVDRVQGMWQVSTRGRDGTVYVLRLREFYKDDPTDLQFMVQDVGGREVSLVAGHEDIPDNGTARARTPVENEILTDLLTRWRALSLIAAF